MRRSLFRGGAMVVVSLMLASGAVAGPREPREPRDRESAVVKLVKKVVRALGDGITVPTPGPKP